MIYATRFFNKKYQLFKLSVSAGWNMLFFLWGIFRGRRINHSDSTKSACIPSLNVMPNEKDFPSLIMTLSETWCSPKRIDEESIDQGHNKPCRNFDSKGTVFGQTHLELQVKLERQDSRVNTKSTSGIQITGTQLFQEMNSSGSSLVIFYPYISCLIDS